MLFFFFFSSIPFGEVHPLLTTMGDNSEWLKLPIDQKCEHKVMRALCLPALSLWPSKTMFLSYISFFIKKTDLKALYLFLKFSTHGIGCLNNFNILEYYYLRFGTTKRDNVLLL